MVCTYRQHIHHHVHFALRAPQKARQQDQSVVRVELRVRVRPALRIGVLQNQAGPQQEQTHDLQRAIDADGALSQVDGQTETVASKAHEQNDGNHDRTKGFRGVRLSHREPHGTRIGIVLDYFIIFGSRVLAVVAVVVAGIPLAHR